MSVVNFGDRLTDAIAARGAPTVIGVDPVLEKLPPPLRPRGQRLEDAAAMVEAFCRGVIDAVAPLVPAIKPNIGFFEALYDAGYAAYRRTVAYAHARGLLVIGDIKRGDIGSTAKLYARGHLAAPGFTDSDPAAVPDAVTLAGYLGRDAVQPFVDVCRAEGKGAFVLVRPSDPGADEVHDFGRPSKLYQHMAALVRRWGEQEGLVGRCGLSCVGAVVAPKDAASTAMLRAAMPHTPFLVPGYGAQGAGAEQCRPCFRPDGTGAIVNASRSVIYAFESPEYASRFGEDWQACVRAACEDFVADVRRAVAR